MKPIITGPWSRRCLSKGTAALFVFAASRRSGGGVCGFGSASKPSSSNPKRKLSNFFVNLGRGGDTHCHRSDAITRVYGGTATGSDVDEKAASGAGDDQEQQRDSKFVQDALYRIRQVNSMPPEVSKVLLPFQVDGVVLGKVHPSTAKLLVETATGVFDLKESDQPPSLTLTQKCGTTCEERSQAVARVMEQLRDQGKIPGWRDELYPVAASFGDEPTFLMERAAVPLLGVMEYGVHINGMVLDESSSETGVFPLSNVKMWMARRSATKSKYPNMLDHIVAGGQPAGLSLVDNCIKECVEEAGIPEPLTRAGLVSNSAISYETYNDAAAASMPSSISRVVLFNFDLYLPSSFEPTPVDGEVQEFFLWNVEQLLQSLDPDFADPIKPNCYVVIIDWLLRHGCLASPDTPGYLTVLRELRSGDCQ